MEAEAKLGHVRGISEAAELNQGLAGDPEAVGLECMQLSVNLRGRKQGEGAGGQVQDCWPGKIYKSGWPEDESR